MKLAIAFPGNTNLISTFGGAPYFLSEALQAVVPTVGLNLEYSGALKIDRYIWNIGEALFGKGFAGFQYTDRYLNNIWAKSESLGSDVVIINMFQLYSRRFFSNSRAIKGFYIDQTLLQLFDGYRQFPPVSSVHQREAMETEGYQYRHADFVICQCEWAARSVIDDYRVEPSKVSVVKPGANISLGLSRSTIMKEQRPPSKEFSSRDPLKLVFVGKDPLRKGLYRLLNALDLLGDLRNRVSVTVIGPTTRDVPARYLRASNVTWLGRLDKNARQEAFLKILAENELGVLASTAEAGGISLREFQLCGLGVLGPDTGGAPEMVAPGAGMLISPSNSLQDIASNIRKLLLAPELVASMRSFAHLSRKEFTWQFSVSQMLPILARIEDNKRRYSTAGAA